LCHENVVGISRTLEKFWSHGKAAPVAVKLPQEKKIGEKKLIFPYVYRDNGARTQICK